MKFLNKFLKKQKGKIFCISFQRTGTTSVAEFFRKNGFKVVDWSFDRYEWTRAYVGGDYEKIFRSNKFIEFQVFEDHPWFFLDFYKVLYHRFPTSKFILFTRDADRWFDSLAYLFNKMHDIKVTYNHYKAYRIEESYYEILDKNTSDNLPRLTIPESMREKYLHVYNLRNREVLEFFKNNDSCRLIHLELEDPEKWEKLGRFFNIFPIKGLNTHENKSTKK